MPVISTRRYSTSSGSSSYLPPSVGGTTSSLSSGYGKTSSGYGASYRSSSLSNTYTSSYSSSSGASSYLPRTSSFRSSLYSTSTAGITGPSSYRHSTYLTGGNNDTTATSRFGVSSNKYTRSSSDRDTKRITGKTQFINNNNINNIKNNNTLLNTTTRTKPLQSKPPIAGSLRSSQRLLSKDRDIISGINYKQNQNQDQVTSKSDQNCIDNNNYQNCNNTSNCIDSNNSNSKFASASTITTTTTKGQSPTTTTTTTTKTSTTTGQDSNSNPPKKRLSSSLSSSSSSLARQVATSGLDLYQKYSPVHYIPKCELSRSRSLSEATSNKYNNDNKLSNSSSNVHQLLQQKELHNINNKLQDSKDYKISTTTPTTITTTNSSTTTTPTTASNLSSSPSSKDISTTQLANKVKKLLFADTASNQATNNNNNNFTENLNASSIVVFNNNNNNNHKQNQTIIQADAKNSIISNKIFLQTDFNCSTEKTTAQYKNSLNENDYDSYTTLSNLDSSSSKNIIITSKAITTTTTTTPPSINIKNSTIKSNQQDFSVVDSVVSCPISKLININSNNNNSFIDNSCHCTHIYISNHHLQKQKQQLNKQEDQNNMKTCSNCNKTIVSTIIIPSSSDSHSKLSSSSCISSTSLISSSLSSSSSSSSLSSMPSSSPTTTTTVTSLKSPTQPQQISLQSQSNNIDIKNAITQNNSSATIISINTPINNVIGENNSSLIKNQFNLQTTKQLLNAEIGDDNTSNKNIPKSNFYVTKQYWGDLLSNNGNGINNNNTNVIDNAITSSSSSSSNNSKICNSNSIFSPTSVTVTYHTSTTTVTIKSSNVITTVNANINHQQLQKQEQQQQQQLFNNISNKNNLHNFHLEFSKHKQFEERNAKSTISTTEIAAAATATATTPRTKTISSTAYIENLTPTTISPTSPTTTLHTTSNGGSNTHYFGQSLFSTYRDQNFLKNECEIARSQLIKLNSNGDIKLTEEYNNNQNNNNNKLFTDNTSPQLLNIKNSSSSGNNKYIVNPLIHKTSKLAKITTTSITTSTTTTNNNMNCLQSNSEFLDDIKYIDSDDSERQQSCSQQTKSSSSCSSSSSSSSSVSANSYCSSSTATFDKTANNLNHYTKSNVNTSTLSSTLPLTSKQQRYLINSDTNSKPTTTANKYNTLNDFKRVPVRNTSPLLVTATNNSISSRLTPSPNPLLSNNISPTNRMLSIAAISIPNKNQKTKTSSCVTPTAVVNNISNSHSSRESTPSNSPQMLRRNNLLNGSSNSNSPISTTTTTTTSTIHHHHYHQHFNHVHQHHHQQQKQQLIPVSNSLSSSSSSTTSSSSLLNDKKLSNKFCDNDESVRNASIRSALPPSPTPSRHWDREGRTSGYLSRFNDLDDYSTRKSTLNSTDEKSSTEGLCGLRNIGNTCFMNSVIQCLSHTRELTKFLKTQTLVKSSSKDQQILYEFAKLIREMWTPNKHSVTPLELKSAFSSKHRMYSGYNQQDAQEFLRFFLDSLHCALNTGVKGEHLKIDESLSDNRKADLTWEWYSKIENSVIRDLFVGQLKSSLKCTTCGNTSVTFDPFWDLSVSLPSSSRCKLDACLDLFIREEVLDGDEMPTCSKCQARRKCTKSFSIQRFPKYLVIHLKRFSETRWSKLSNIVEFPTGERELNMAPYASNSSSNVYYSLYAISNHMGSTAGGHYVALCKHPVTKKWHEFNDNIVSDDLSESVLVSSSAYLLFYERA